MCLSLALPPKSILAHVEVRTTLSKKFNGRNPAMKREAEEDWGKRGRRIRVFHFGSIGGAPGANPCALTRD
jgi:hypothetical protein